MGFQIDGGGGFVDRWWWWIFRSMVVVGFQIGGCDVFSD